MKKIGMFKDMARSAFKKPVTERYPYERRPAGEEFRGMLHWNPSDCTGCGLCVKDCPAEAIELITVDKANKRFVFRYHIDRCTFCGQCAYSCRFDCINLSNDEWELAELNRDDFTVVYGATEDVENLSLEEEIEPVVDHA